MRELFESMPPWWVLLASAMVGAAAVFAFLWSAWIIALALEIEP